MTKAKTMSKAKEEKAEKRGDNTTMEVRIENEVRRRMTEYLSSAGVSAGRISMESLYMLPAEFLSFYIELFGKALKEDLSGSGAGMKEKGELGKRGVAGDMKGKRIGATGNLKGGRFKEFWVIRDENALRVKGLVDGKLRGMIAEMIGELKAGFPANEVSERCSGKSCRRFMKENWQYCPYCGATKM